MANPGDEPVTVRLTSMDDEETERPILFEVPPAAEVVRKVPAGSRASATYIEVFGGWAAAGWVVRAGGRESGSAAEPCAPAGARTWYASEPTTQRGEQAFLVVMNPFAADAVFDVTLYTPDRPPFRDPDWIDLTVHGGRSMSLRLDKLVPGEDVVAAEVAVKSGRVATGTLGITETGGVRGALGSTGTSSSWLLPTALGTGQDSLVVFAPGEMGVRFGATLLSEQPPQPAGGLVQQEQALQSARAYPIVTSGPSAVEISAQGEQPLVTALRAQGPGSDWAAASGTLPAPSWVVLPTADGDPSTSALVIVNPGDEPVVVTLTALPRSVTASAAGTTITVPAASTMIAPAEFLRDVADAAVLVHADGPIVAFGSSLSGSSLSGGRDGTDRFTLAPGVQAPTGNA